MCPQSEEGSSVMGPKPKRRRTATASISHSGGSDDSSRSVGKDERGNVPSDLAKDFTRFNEYQTEGNFPKFLCGRPQGTDPPFPLMILEKDFGEFIKTASEVDGVEKQDLVVAQALFSDLNSLEYVTKHEDRVEYIQELLSAYINRLVHAISLKNVTTDASVVISWAVAVILGFKSELGVSGDPYTQGADYVRRLCRKSSGIWPDRSQHGLLISFLGPNMQVSAYFYDASSDRVWMEPLTWIFCYGPEKNLYAAAAVLRAIRQFTKAYAPQESGVPWLLRGFKGAVQLLKGKNIFLATRDEGHKVVAKYVHRLYSVEAHRAWEGAGVAPRLLDVVDDVGDGWKLLQMEYLGEPWVSAQQLVSERRKDADFIKRFTKLMRRAVELGHETGFVHGDLRLANVLVNKESLEVKVIDFEWAGAVGVAKYPRMPNDRHVWPAGAQLGAHILPEHDLWLADNPLPQLQVRKVKQGDRLREALAEHRTQ